MQLWYAQSSRRGEPARNASYLERWLPENVLPGLSSRKLMTGTRRSIEEVTPCASASWMVVVTSVRKLGSAVRTVRARAGMSLQAQVSGGSSQVYWNSRSNQPRSWKRLAHSDAFPRSSTAVRLAPGSRVAPEPSMEGA